MKEPIAVESAGPLAVATDGQLVAALDWVIVKDGPGTWAKNAYWDEYVLRIVNESAEPVSVSSVAVVDSVGTTVASLGDRKQLVKGSKQAKKRYKTHDLDVHPGANAGAIAAAGAASYLIAGGIAAGAAAEGAIAAMFGMTATTSGAALAGATALVVASPILVVGGIVKASNNSKVNEEIKYRQADLPVDVASGENQTFSVFFPVSPSPSSVEITYSSKETESVLAIDTNEALRGLHLKTEEPAESL